MNSIQANAEEKLAQLRADLRIGLMINSDGGSFAAVENLSQARFEALQSRGDVFVMISRQRALDLALTHDPSRDAVLRLPKDYRFGALKALADPSLALDYLGKGPLRVEELPEGMAARILEFCRHSRLLPAAIWSFEAEKTANGFDEALWAFFETSKPHLVFVSSARVPLARAASSQLHVFRELDGDSEHYAIITGGSLDKTPLVRLHSACFTGDCLGSMKCDCGPQLDLALERIAAEGGILLYLSQEGRGIGLPNKIRAYRLQDQGFDTVEANLKMGFGDDERDFRIGAEILKYFKVSQIRLLTNNPRKIEWLENSGIEVVERVPIKIEAGADNEAYLSVKAKKSGHLL